MKFARKVFGEFVLELPVDANEVQLALLEDGVLAGLPLGKFYPGMDDCLLVAVTEVRTKDQIDDLAMKLKEVIA